jgi:hypothetical protein
VAAYRRGSRRGGRRFFASGAGMRRGLRSHAAT